MDADRYLGEADVLDMEQLSKANSLASVEYHVRLPSTQDRAHEIAAQQGAALPRLILADAQTSGRGRGANRWWTGAGSLAFSLLFDPAGWNLPRGVSPQRSLAAALAVIDTVAPHLMNHVVGLHWPNDVFAGSRKLAGILIDVLPDGRHILGIGLNVNNSLADAPSDVRARASSLLDLTGVKHDRTGLLLMLLAQLEVRFRELALSPDQIGREFHQRCLQVGKSLAIQCGSQRTSGVCAGIAVDGALLLETEQGLKKFYSGVLDHGVTA